MTHYDTLGVEPNASPDDIKQAFRSKASKAHPDKGGDSESMKSLNIAYEVLSNPSKRDNYDKTGQDAEPGGDTEALTMLAKYMEKALQCDHPDPVAFTKNAIKAQLGELSRVTTLINGNMEKAKKKIGLVVSTGPHNVYESVLLGLISTGEKNLLAIFEQRALLTKVLELLADYSTVPQEPEDIGPAVYAYSTFTSTIA